MTGATGAADTSPPGGLRLPRALARFDVTPFCHVPRMCMLCDGFSQEDMIAAHAAIIEEHGYLVTGVGDCDPPHWAYTVGLLDRVEHPELIVAGPQFEVAGAIINHVGRQILAGSRFAAGDMLVTPHGAVRFGVVNPIQYRLSTFNVWFAMAAHGHLRCDELQAIQVIAPRESICDCGLCDQPDLSRPESRVGVAPLRPNRAQRRARPRR